MSSTKNWQQLCCKNRASNSNLVYLSEFKHKLDTNEGMTWRNSKLQERAWLPSLKLKLVKIVTTASKYFFLPKVFLSSWSITSCCNNFVAFKFFENFQVFHNCKTSSTGVIKLLCVEIASQKHWVYDLCQISLISHFRESFSVKYNLKEPVKNLCIFCTRCRKCML